MKKLKVMTIVGTRPELIKLSLVIPLLDQYMDHVLVHTGQNYDYELNQIFFDDLGIRAPNHFLEIKTGSASETIGEIIIATHRLLVKEKPDAVLVYGDTNSALSVMAAKKLQIPIFHMEAGNRSFDERVPEEANRRMIDHISDINMTLSEHARRYLIDEGIKPETVIKIGSNLPDIYRHYASKINSSTILQQHKLSVKQYFVVSAHREENVDDPSRLQALLNTLKVIAERYQFPMIVSMHPRTHQRLLALEQNDYASIHPLITFQKPLSFTDYMSLQKNAFCVLSDSGSLTEDAHLLQFPAVMIRDSHERPEGMDVGTCLMAGLTPDRVLGAIEIATQSDYVKSGVPDYDCHHVAEKVIQIIQSYVAYVRQTVYRKFEGREYA